MGSPELVGRLSRGSEAVSLARHPATASKASSPDPHPLDRRGHVGGPEADRLAQLEAGNQPGHAPVVELAATDLEVAGEVMFGHQVWLAS
jgi:hypothetical protein